MTDAEIRYELAKDLAERVRQQWDEEGCPLTTLGGATGRATVPHPLVKMLSEALALADRMERVLKRAHRGPEPSAVVVADVGVSPAAKLRAVK